MVFESSCYYFFACKKRLRMIVCFANTSIIIDYYAVSSSIWLNIKIGRYPIVFRRCGGVGCASVFGISDIQRVAPLYIKYLIKHKLFPLACINSACVSGFV